MQLEILELTDVILPGKIKSNKKESFNNSPFLIKSSSILKLTQDDTHINHSFSTLIKFECLDFYHT